MAAEWDQMNEALKRALNGRDGSDASGPVRVSSDRLSAIGLNDALSGLAGSRVGTTLVALARKYRGDRDILTNSIRGIFALGYNAQNKVLLHDAGAIPVVVQAMQEHADCEGVQVHGSHALANLVWNNARNSEDVGAAEAWNLVLAAMSRFPESEPMHSNGCVCIMNFARNNARNADALCQMAAWNAVLKSMHDFPQSEGVQLRGCGAFICLASNARNSDLLMQAHVWDAVRAAMSGHPESPTVQFNSCIAIEQLCSRNAAHAQVLKDGGASPLVIQAMLRHTDNADVLSAGSKALYQLWQQRGAAMGCETWEVGLARMCIQSGILRFLQHSDLQDSGYRALLTIGVSAGGAAPGANPPAIPPEFVCPITGDIMRDPVLTSDGFTFERRAIEAWLRLNNRSPMTNLPLPNRGVLPNIALRQLIEDFLLRNPGLTPRGFVIP
jgi:hypothetical protein